MNDKQNQLIEYILQDIIFFIVEETGVEFDIAMNEFYTSQVFDKLHDEKTGLYLESSLNIYDLYKTEKAKGYIEQNEI